MRDYNLNIILNLYYIGLDEAAEYLYEELDFSIDTTPRSTHGNNAANEKPSPPIKSAIKTATNK
jgi:hypothetical protein